MNTKDQKTRILSGEVERIRQIYQEDVLKNRTRTIVLAGRKCHPQILYTFLGYELKMGRKRIACPDIITARYLKVFAEIGMESVRLPYDPTHTRVLLPGLEHALGRIQETLLELNLGKKAHQRALAKIYRQIREKCSSDAGDIGSGYPARPVS